MSAKQRAQINPDGSFNVDRRGIHASLRHDLYHFLQAASWARLIALLSLLYILANLVFALLYLPGLAGLANARSGSFADAFFFSVQTMSTVGYGYLAPQSLYINLIMVIESVFGFLLTAVATGLIFAKFSRVRARVLFSQVAVIHTLNGKKVLSFRAANQRHAEIVDASIKVALTRDEQTAEGYFLRRFYDLKLERDTSPLFALVWNIYHVIDESSPLFGKNAEDIQNEASVLLVSFSGIDDHLVQTLHTRHAYNSGDIHFGRRLTDIIGWSEEGRRFVDYRRFHETEAEF